jgi:GNAT superfamily N-acetyltransferase
VTVTRLDPGPATVEAVTALLCDAFADYPVMRFLLGSTGDYRARLRTLIGLFVANRAVPGDPFFGYTVGTELGGVALCTPPNPPAVSPALEEIRERAWATLGTDVRDRYAACVNAWGEVGIAEANVHLNMIGVRPRYRGRGLARPLLERVQALSRELPASHGVTLTTEDPRNVTLYRYFGYELVDRRRIAPELETWGFFRPDRASFEA